MKAQRHGDSYVLRFLLISAAGHPTIGCAVYALGTLAKNASRGRFFANAGAIELGLVDGVATASIPHDVHIHTPDAFTLEEFYKLQPVLRPASITEDAIQVVSPVKGMNFVTVELPDIEALAAIATSTGKPKPRLDDNWNVGFSGNYFYVLNSHSNASSASSVETLAIRARMTDGALEHPASGSAACALAASLALKRAVDRTSRYEITQGVEMGRQSDIIVTVTLTEARDAVERVELSGSAVKVMEGVLEC